jgi:hypothetical protein
MENEIESFSLRRNDSTFVMILELEELEQYNSLVHDRRVFELMMYDYLVNPHEIVDPSFWEPVVVCFENVKSLEDIIQEEVCTICMEKHCNFKKVNCCNQILCNGCCYEWFKKSVKCPYCFQDIREFNLKKPV